MLRLTENQHGPAATERALRFILIRLKPYAQAVGLRERLKGHRVTLRDRREELAEAVEERIAGTVEIEYRDGRINKKVVEVASLMRPVLQRTEAGRAALAAALPSNTSDAMKGVLDVVQGRYVENLCQRLDADPELATWKPEAAALRQLETEAQAAVTAREALYVAEGQARTQAKLQTARAQRDYNLAFAELTLAFPDDPELVESFFWRETKVEEAEPAPTPSPAPA